MGLSRNETRLLENVLKSVVSKMGGGTENHVKKVMSKKRVTDRYVSRPREDGKYPKYSEFAKKLYMSSWDRPTNYGRARTPMA